MVAQAAPFVGRDADLRQLKAALGQAGEGAGSLVLVSGEAGIGKTRLSSAHSRVLPIPASPETNTELPAPSPACPRAALSCLRSASRPTNGAA